MGNIYTSFYTLFFYISICCFLFFANTMGAPSASDTDVTQTNLVKRDSDHAHSEPSKLSTGHVWLYTMISITILTLVAALGIFVAPLVSTSSSLWNRVLMSFLIALGIGTLIGDAFLHLLLSSLGFHSHDHKDSPHEGGDVPHVHASDVMSTQTAFWTMLILLTGVMFFFLADHVCRLFCPGSHVHHHPPTPPDVNRPVSYGMDTTTSPSSSSDELPILRHTEPPFKPHSHHSHAHVHPTTPRHVVGLILLGDALHNFMDGLAIGMTFAESSTRGWSTTLTVFCHELPHELGDIAVLLGSGMAKWRVAMYNMGSNLTSFVGGMLGILLYQAFTESVQRRILAFIAGGFLYIALVNLMPLLMTSLHQDQTAPHVSLKQKYLHFFVQCFGLVLGIGFMVLMALYEQTQHEH